jgi:hypothetical protein
MRDVLRAWSLVQGQWRVGMAGIVSGDYGSWAAVLRPYGLWRRRIIEALRVFEAEALREARERERAQRYYGDADYAAMVEEAIRAES